MLLYMYQIFSSLRSHLHVFVHFFFTYMEYFFCGHPISTMIMIFTTMRHIAPRHSLEAITMFNDQTRLGCLLRGKHLRLRLSENQVWWIMLDWGQDHFKVLSFFIPAGPNLRLVLFQIVFLFWCFVHLLWNFMSSCSYSMTNLASLTSSSTELLKTSSKSTLPKRRRKSAERRHVRNTCSSVCFWGRNNNQIECWGPTGGIMSHWICKSPWRHTLRDR